MSEYQYYEFQTIDRPLTQEQMDELRGYSTRAQITPTSFVNVYHWGSFKGDPDRWMEKYFDLNAPLQSLADFLRIDADLIAAAAEQSAKGPLFPHGSSLTAGLHVRALTNSIATNVKGNVSSTNQ